MFEEIRPTEEIPVTVAEEGSLGFMGWLDDVGSTIGEYAGAAVNLLAGDWFADLKQNIGSEGQVDVTAVDPDKVLSGNTGAASWITAHKTELMIGGGLVAAAVTIWMFSRGRG